MTLATGSAFFVSHPRGALSFHSSFIAENPGIFFAAVVERGPEATAFTLTLFLPT